MDESCLQYVLTDSEREQFNTEGYLVLEHALSPGKVAALTEVTDRTYRRKVDEGFDPKKHGVY